MFGGRAGIFLDPPYDFSTRAKGLYAVDSDIFGVVVDWCAKNGSRDSLRIALCGNEDNGVSKRLVDWKPLIWSRQGGASNMAKMGTRCKANSNRECIWFSPHCLNRSLLTI